MYRNVSAAGAVKEASLVSLQETAVSWGTLRYQVSVLAPLVHLYVPDLITVLPTF